MIQSVVAMTDDARHFLSALYVDAEQTQHLD